METRKIVDIVITDRTRKDIGDVSGLAQSILSVALLHPVVITPENRLVSGRRRIEAFRQLGRKEIPVTVIHNLKEAKELLIAERDENTCRKDLTPSEAVEMGRRLEPVERIEAKERERTHTKTGYGKLPDPEKGEAAEKVASTVGMSRRTYEKARDVVEAAEAEPEKYGHLKEKMDKTGKVDPAYKQYKKAKRKEAKAKTPENLPPVTGRYRIICADIKDAKIEPESVDWIITDPPYPKEFLPVYSNLSEFAACVLKPGGSMLVMVGQSYLPEVMQRLSENMTYYWVVCYLTPGGQSSPVWARKVNTFWKPLLWYVKGKYSGDHIGDVCKSNINDNDKQYHDWGQSESGMVDIIGRFTCPGQTICDPFCGGGTTGIVAVRLNRFFIGIDNDREAVQTTIKRLSDE